MDVDLTATPQARPPQRAMETITPILTILTITRFRMTYR
jgi:hypothetical protein